MDAKEVPELVQAGLSVVKIRSIHRFAVMEDTRADVRAFCRAHLGLAENTAVVKSNVAAVLEVWEAAKQRLDRQTSQAGSAERDAAASQTDRRALRKIGRSFGAFKNKRGRFV